MLLIRGLRAPNAAAVVIISVSALGSPGCGADYACAEGGSADQVERRHAIGALGVQAHHCASFAAAGKDYELVHVEFGEPQDCMAGCYFSHLCTVVAGSQDHVTSFSFSSKDEFLFDPALYCPKTPPGADSAQSSPRECSLPGLKLPLMVDPDFMRWVKEPDDVNDDMRWCRNPISLAYSLGVITN